MVGKIAVKYDGLSANYTPNWLLDDSEYPPTGSHFEYLINGETAFLRLFDEISSAKNSIDIAIWGFQPSMFFKRDGKSKCIGELLAQKANDGVEVRVLVWSMKFIVERAQTYQEDSTNLGSSKSSLYNVPGSTSWQHDYDRAWYYAVGFDKYDTSAKNLIQREKLEKILKSSMCREINNLRTSTKKNNLIFKTREVAKQEDNYLDHEISKGMKQILTKFASHHQKTVLIDYMFPKNAKGFILEHNMLDGYWDTNSHSIQSKAPNIGKNSPTPLQDTSSFLRGPILHHINHNFCQSWQRVTDENLLRKRLQSSSLANAQAKKEQYAVQNPIAIQALRTYDSPNIEDIKHIYLKNISKTTSYIYTENQYFRWPPLVQAFKDYWQDMKRAGRKKDPIYWFVVTNASDTGIGSGTANADRMFAALGRRDVLPNVAINRDKSLKVDYDKKFAKLEKEAQFPNVRPGSLEGARAVVEKYQLAQKKLADAQAEYFKSFKKDLSKEIGIKCHVCVLHSMDSNPKKWQEIYIHSKVTMINDVFLTMGSANINTRSMQGDTEMNLALEHGETVKKLRQALWHLNTRTPAANPEAMHLNSTASDAFDQWQSLIRKNSDLKSNGKKPQQPLTEFLRLSPKVSNID